MKVAECFEDIHKQLGNMSKDNLHRIASALEHFLKRNIERQLNVVKNEQHRASETRNAHLLLNRVYIESLRHIRSGDDDNEMKIRAILKECKESFADVVYELMFPAQGQETKEEVLRQICNFCQQQCDQVSSLTKLIFSVNKHLQGYSNSGWTYEVLFIPLGR